jgi:hypothetical protein
MGSLRPTRGVVTRASLMCGGTRPGQVPRTSADAPAASRLFASLADRVLIDWCPAYREGAWRSLAFRISFRTRCASI